jgi:single-strand DNA-binding protein
MTHQLVVLVGNLGKDPEMKFLPSGTAVTNFSIATNRKWNDPDGTKHEETTWFRIATFGKTAENCNQFLKKGQQVYVQGRLNCDPSTGGPKIFQRQDGTAGAAFEVTASEVRFLGSKGDGTVTAPAAAPADQDDGIPF